MTSEDGVGNAAATNAVATARPPRLWLALLLSIVMPGLGHLYARDRVRAILFWIIAGPLVTAPLIGLFQFIWPSPQLVVGVAFVLLAVTVACLVDVWRSARKSARQSRATTPWWGYALFIIFSAGSSFVATSLNSHGAIRTFSTSTASMEPSLAIGDLFVTAVAPRFRQDIDYGDIILFWREESDWVKRVVGLPGDRIEFRNGNLILNGIATPLASNGVETELHFAGTPWFLETLPNGVVVPIKRIVPNNILFDDVIVTVPPNSYFVLGDNRDRSADSRVFGVVPADMIVGRAAFIYWPPTRIGQSLTAR
jgi:signal peptidase I